MSSPFIGEIRMFGGSYAPVNWLLCNGQQAAVSEYQALFALIGTTYGGNGVTSFALPDLRGRVPVAQGQGTGLTTRVIGQMYGTTTVTITPAQIPNHSHTLMGSSNAGTSTSPTGNVFATTANSDYASPSASAVPSAMQGQPVQASGGGQAHENMMPTQALNFIICVNGLYPSPN